MNTKSLYPTVRLQMGTVILAAAEVVDTKVVAERVGAFAEAHRQYGEAQHQIEAAEAELQAAKDHLGSLDAEQDSAVEALACTLVGDRQERGSPFAEFGMPAPSVLKQLPFDEEAKAIQQLAAAVQRHAGVNKASVRAAQAAEQAAQKMAAALVPIHKLEAAVRTARERREALGQNWDATYAALNYACRAGAADGTPGLHSALFGGVRKAKRKRKPAVDTAAQQQSPPSNAAADSPSTGAKPNS